MLHQIIDLGRTGRGAAALERDKRDLSESMSPYYLSVELIFLLLREVVHEIDPSQLLLASVRFFLRIRAYARRVLGSGGRTRFSGRRFRLFGCLCCCRDGGVDLRGSRR